MADEKFSYESLHDTDSIVPLLEYIAQGFKHGTITLSSEENSISLVPSGLLGLALKAKQDSGECKLELSINWKDTPNTKAISKHGSI